MKKFLLSLIALLGVATYALADGVTVADVQIKQGKTGTIELRFDITSDVVYRDFQFDVYMPEGFSIVKEGERYLGSLGDAASEHSLGRELQDDGAVRYVGSNNDGLALKSGVLVTIPVEAPGLAAGATGVGELRSFLISKEDGTQQSFDLTFNIEVIEDVLVLEETSTTAPTAVENQTVLVKRTIKPDVWSTLCLPFDMTAEQVKSAFGEDVKLADYTGWTYELDDDDLEKSITINFTSCNSITANKPLLIKTSQLVESFRVENADVDPDDTEIKIKESVKEKKNGSMIGVYTVTELDDDEYLFLSGNNFYYSNGSTMMKAFRAYFYLKVVLDDEYKPKPSASMVKVAIDEEEATSIEDLRFVDTKGAVYTVDGKFIGRDVDLKKLQKGIYVVDGKKVAIK